MRRASKLGIWYAVNGAGGGGSTQAAGSSNVRRPGGVAFLAFEPLEAFFRVDGTFLVFLEGALLLDPAVVSAAMGDESCEEGGGAESRVGGVGGFGSFHCSSFSNSHRQSLPPPCSIMKSEMWTMRPRALLRNGCSHS